MCSIRTSPVPKGKPATNHNLRVPLLTLSSRPISSRTFISSNPYPAIRPADHRFSATPNRSAKSNLGNTWHSTTASLQNADTIHVEQDSCECNRWRTVSFSSKRFSSALSNSLIRYEYGRLIALRSKSIRGSGMLGICPLAEGVETEAEAIACRQLGFEFAQGYYFARPLPPSQCGN